VRLLRLVGLGVAGALGVAALMVAPVLWGFVPWWMRNQQVPVALAALAVAAAGLRAARSRARRRVRRAWVRAERAARRVFPGRLAVIAAAGCAGLWLAWAPAYVTWPYCRDEDAYATIAMGWDRGDLPYRDVKAYNFPGHMYLHWMIGHAFGWGRTASFYALDALMVAGLGVALAAWGRRRLGGMLPGLVGYAAFLHFYLAQDYESVAERDWHATLFVVLGLMASQAWPGRTGRVASALGLAVALAIRPHAVLFVPAMGLAVAQGARGTEPGVSGTRSGPAFPAECRGGAWRAVGEWAAWVLVFVALAFAPVLAAGIADDLVRGLRTASYGGPYSRATPASILAAFGAEFHSWRLRAILAGLVATAALGPSRLRPPARAWGLATLAALAYGPLHPVQHAYLAHPREVVPAVALALPAAWLVGARRLSRAFRLAATLLVLALALPAPPQFCRPGESLAALGDLASGGEPLRAPRGAHRFFRAEHVESDPYPWRDYRGVLAYLRRDTSPGTLVANVLRRVPFPSINGPAGRPSPFLAESGICWMWLVDEDLDGAFAAQLERAADSDPRSVVVWNPDEREVAERMRLPKVVEVIRRRYRPEARFGPFAVWRRAPASGAARASTAPPPPSTPSGAPAGRGTAPR
jgi:hypothetical protein